MLPEDKTQFENRLQLLLLVVVRSNAHAVFCEVFGVLALPWYKFL